MQLYDMNGVCCGNFSDSEAPENYWLREDDAPTEMTALEFLDKLGPTRFGTIWQVSISNPQLAFSMMRGFAAQSILIGESFPTLRQMETMGLLPEGTAFEVWA